MNGYRFEIVRRRYDRYSWIVVAAQQGRRRIVASSGRDYRTKAKVASVIERLQKAQVIDATGTTPAQPIQLPETSFHLVSGVLPLPVAESPMQDPDGVARDDTAQPALPAGHNGATHNGATHGDTTQGSNAQEGATPSVGPAGVETAAEHTGVPAASGTTSA